CNQHRHDADRGRARMTWRRPVWALHVLIVGLALHNLVMSSLWRAGVRGTALTIVSAWKDVLLVVALALMIYARRGLPFKSAAADWLALSFGAPLAVSRGVPLSHSHLRGILQASLSGEPGSPGPALARIPAPAPAPARARA